MPDLDKPDAPIRTIGAVWIVALLFAANVLNFIDRQLPSILAQSIRTELHLSDTQLGLITGLSFSIVYSLLGLPLAQLADRWSAKWVMVLSLVTWSALTATGGFARSFFELALARTGVAAGEAGGTPSAHAAISSLVSPGRRSLAISIFSLGVPAGVMTGLMLGGWLNDTYNWRTAMMVMAPPGAVIALLLSIFMPGKSPHRQAKRAASFAKTFSTLMRMRSYRQLCIGVTIFGVGSYSLFGFVPAFLIRSFGLSAREAGLYLGLANGLSGAVGVLAGGWLADLVGRRRPASIALIPAVGFAVAAPGLLAALLSPTAPGAIGLLIIPYLANVLFIAPTFGVAQSLAPEGMKA